MNRPYFEMEVEKVKKEKIRCKHYKYMVGYVPQGSYYNCPVCGERVYIKSVKEIKSKGNWVNGENLDAIKFPCFGWYQSGTGKRYCELDFIQGKSFFRVKELKQHQLNKKKDYSYAEFWDTDLKRLIDMLDFHILKGKIIIYEEEK